MINMFYRWTKDLRDPVAKRRPWRIEHAKSRKERSKGKTCQHVSMSTCQHDKPNMSSLVNKGATEKESIQIWQKLLIQKYGAKSNISISSFQKPSLLTKDSTRKSVKTKLCENWHLCRLGFIIFITYNPKPAMQNGSFQNKSCQERFIYEIYMI